MNVSKYFVVNFLLSRSEIVSLVEDRVYPRVAGSMVELPFVVVRKANETRDATLDGPSRIVTSRIEIYCVAPTDEKMEAIKEAIIELFHGRIISSGAVRASFKLVNDADVDDDFEETSFTGILEFDVMWDY